MVVQVSVATGPAKRERVGDKLGFTADHGDNRVPQTRQCRGKIVQRLGRSEAERVGAGKLGGGRRERGTGDRRQRTGDRDEERGRIRKLLRGNVLLGPRASRPQ